MDRPDLPLAARYFVKCLACDQTFWLPHVDQPVPDHGPWNRRLERVARSRHGCPGAGQPGYWLGEEFAEMSEESEE